MAGPITDLLELQLQIARRADELANARPGVHGRREDRDCWLQAEEEILSHVAELAAM